MVRFSECYCRPLTKTKKNKELIRFIQNKVIVMDSKVKNAQVTDTFLKRFTKQSFTAAVKAWIADVLEYRKSLNRMRETGKMDAMHYRLLKLGDVDFLKLAPLIVGQLHAVRDSIVELTNSNRSKTVQNILQDVWCVIQQMCASWC